MNKFDCSKCNGVCCANPPLLRTFEEGMRAKRYGVEIVATGSGESGYMIAIAKKNDVCPFLSVDTGECLIYENRFASCRVYECGLVGGDVQYALTQLVTKPEVLNEQLKTEKPKPLTGSQVRKIGAKIIRSRKKLLQKISATHIETFIMLIEKAVEKNTKGGRI
jgi:hypothetical protein